MGIFGVTPLPLHWDLWSYPITSPLGFFGIHGVTSSPLGSNGIYGVTPSPLHWDPWGFLGHAITPQLGSTGICGVTPLPLHWDPLGSMGLLHHPSIGIHGDFWGHPITPPLGSMGIFGVTPSPLHGDFWAHPITPPLGTIGIHVVTPSPRPLGFIGPLTDLHGFRYLHGRYRRSGSLRFHGFGSSVGFRRRRFGGVAFGHRFPLERTGLKGVGGRRVRAPTL